MPTKARLRKFSKAPPEPLPKFDQQQNELVALLREVANNHSISHARRADALKTIIDLAAHIKRGMER